MTLYFLRNSREYFDAPKVVPRSRQASDEDETAILAAATSSPLFSSLLIPSLKEVNTRLFSFAQVTAFKLMAV